MHRQSAKGPKADKALARGAAEEGRVALAAFGFLFSELCTRAHTAPAKARDLEEIEQRLTAAGALVGARLAMLSSLKDAPEQQRRPTTIDAALKLFEEKFWVRWFGKPVSDLKREMGSDRYFLIDSDPVVLKYVHPSPEYITQEGSWSVNYASFMGGIIEGALGAIGFSAEVITYHQPEQGHPHQSIFAISFSQHVWDRERRVPF